MTRFLMRLKICMKFPHQPFFPDKNTMMQVLPGDTENSCEVREVGISLSWQLSNDDWHFRSTNRSVPLGMALLKHIRQVASGLFLSKRTQIDSTDADLHAASWGALSCQPPGSAQRYSQTPKPNNDVTECNYITCTSVFVREFGERCWG